MTFLCTLATKWAKISSIYSKITKVGGMFRDFFRQKWGACLGIFFFFKSPISAAHPPFTILGEYPPPPPPGVRWLVWQFWRPCIIAPFPIVCMRNPCGLSSWCRCVSEVNMCIHIGINVHWECAHRFNSDPQLVDSQGLHSTFSLFWKKFL